MPATQTTQHATHEVTNISGSVQDASGYAIFASGATGSAHETAHRMLDEGNIEMGHRLLGAWLEGRDGTGSEWIHIHFHMAIFELELGLWDAAYARFTEHILTAAEHTSDALTDAPALAWRLWLTAGSPVFFPWEPMRKTAAARIDTHDDPWVDLHSALALAGAGDLENLDQWLAIRSLRAVTPADRVTLQVGCAVRAFTAGDYLQAATSLGETLPAIAEVVGGSRAQNELFKQIEEACWKRIVPGASAVTVARAA